MDTDAPEPRGLDSVFRPRSIAVVGASRTPGSVGQQVLRNIVEGGFTGAVFPVNPKADAVRRKPVPRPTFRASPLSPTTSRPASATCSS